MINNAIGIASTCAPAGFLRLGSAAVRPFAGAGVAVRPQLVRRRAALRGTGLPTGMPLAQVAPTGVAGPQLTSTPGFAQNDGTTLGIPCSRRPQS